MNIKILKLSLSNFKCFKQAEFVFPADIMNISGRNGAGKTTIADAIFWCLFGKNTAGQSDFDIKTHDDKGKTIPHLDHSVEMELAVSDEGIARQIILKRTIKENWVKKRGSEETVFKSNTTECMVNGEVYTPTDYKKYIASLIDENIFRFITDPLFFPSLNWKEQRSFLSNLIKGESVDVVGTDADLQALKAQLDTNQEDIVAYLKHLSYQKKGIREKLDKIPVRLEEQNKALPELLDWDGLKQEQDNALKERDELDAKIRQLQTGGDADIKRKEISDKIKEVQTKQNAVYEELVKQNLDAFQDKQKKVSEASLKFNEALNNQKQMEMTIGADQRLIERAKEVDYEAQLQQLRDQWPSSKFNIDPSTSYCPTCGQPLPQDQVQEKIAEMRNAFNLAREKKIKELNEAAAKVKKNQEEANEELKRLGQKLEDDTKALETIKESINTIFSEKQNLEKIEVKSVDKLLEESKEFQDYSTKLDELYKQKDSITDSENNKELLDSLNEQKVTINANILILSNKLATRQQYDKISALIEGINEEEKSLVKQLSELEKQEDIGRRYQDRQNFALEQLINGHFSITRWKMFRTVNNNGDPFDEPYCECYDLNGTAYHDGLNQAARLNIGLDIINTLCRHYNVAAPIVLDNAESTISILQTTGQQIRLYVEDTDLNVQ